MLYRSIISNINSETLHLRYETIHTGSHHFSHRFVIVHGAAADDEQWLAGRTSFDTSLFILTVASYRLASVHYLSITITSIQGITKLVR